MRPWRYNVGKGIEKRYLRPMWCRWKALFTSKIEGTLRWDRWDFVALALAVLTVVLVFALKLKTFYDLGYSSDLFVSVQAARSWLEGRGLLHDNCFGNVLTIHTYFLLQQRMIPSIVTALAVISIKEDAPIAAAMVAIVAGVETWISSEGKRARSGFNWPAAIILLLSVSAVPLLLAISWSQSPTIYA